MKEADMEEAKAAGALARLALDKATEAFDLAATTDAECTRVFEEIDALSERIARLEKLD